MNNETIIEMIRRQRALERRLEVLETIEPGSRLSGILSHYLLLPGLRGFWPMSSFDGVGGSYDQSGQGRHLSMNGNPVYSWSSLAPYIALDGTGDYLSRGDEGGLDITGTETYVATGKKGLTLGGWFYVDAFDGAALDGLIGKYLTTGNQRSYLIYINTPSNQQLRFLVSVDGAATVTVPTAAITSGQWYFIAGRFTPSTELAAFVNATKTTNTTSIPASIFNSTTAFIIGSANGSVNPVQGRASLCFLCAAALSDDLINQLYENSRALFGV